MESKPSTVIGRLRQATLITVTNNMEGEAHHGPDLTRNQCLNGLEVCGNGTFITEQPSQVIGVDYEVTVGGRHVCGIQQIRRLNNLTDIEVRGCGRARCYDSPCNGAASRSAV